MSGRVRDAVERLWRRGREALPDVDLPLEAFAPCLDAGASGERVDALPAADLYLACACARGDGAAIARFERHHQPLFGRLAARARSLGVDGDELLQRLRVHLFTGVQGRPPAISTYTGRGPLGGWVRVVAT